MNKVSLASVAVRRFVGKLTTANGNPPTVTIKAGENIKYVDTPVHSPLQKTTITYIS